METAPQAELQQLGTEAHRALHWKAFQINPHVQTSRSVEASDRRCFVASFLLGIDAPETRKLRQFRDRVLLRSTIGRIAVRTYYAVSPHLVAYIAGHPRWRALCRCIVRAIAEIIS
jgi:hypothetical protein